MAALGLEQSQEAKYAECLEAARHAGVIKSTKVDSAPGTTPHPPRGRKHTGKISTGRILPYSTDSFV